MTSFQKIDQALGRYYLALGDLNYFDNNGIGKFLCYCSEHEFDNGDVEDELADGNEQNCGYLGKQQLSNTPITHFLYIYIYVCIYTYR